MFLETIQISAVTFKDNPRGVSNFASRVDDLLRNRDGRKFIVRGLCLGSLSAHNKGHAVVVEDEGAGIEVLARAVRNKIGEGNIGDNTLPVVSLYDENRVIQPEVKKIPGDERARGVYDEADFLQALSEVLLTRK